MRCKREGPPRQSLIVQRAFAVPARCLSAFTTFSGGDAIAELEKIIECVRFQIVCPCGTAEFTILGFHKTLSACPDLNIFSAPISLACYLCGRTGQLFDPNRDGYDGEIDSADSVTGSGESSMFFCPRCGETAFRPAVSLEYSLDDDEMEDSAELAARPQDFFTWFTLFGKCVKCGHLTKVTDYECS